jgi:hypothetical protein
MRILRFMKYLGSFRFTACVVMMLAGGPMASAGMLAAGHYCNKPLTKAFPARSAGASSGSQIARALDNIGDDERELKIRSELLAGNIPEFLRHLQPVVLTARPDDARHTQITVCVMPEYLALGSDDDFLLIPMRLETALAVAYRYGFMLPTPRLVDAIYAQSATHLTPQPLPASSSMRSTDYYRHHNELIGEQRTASGITEGLLISGHKKDLVLTNRLWGNLERVAIYGWHRIDGTPIQPLSTVHGWHYADYSHGARLVSSEILVNDRPQSLYSALEDPQLAAMLSSEGVIRKVFELVDTLRQPKSDLVAKLIRSDSYFD